MATATSVGLDGKPIQVNEFAFTDAWRQNRYYSVTQILTGDQLRDPSKPWNAKSNPYEPKCITIATSNMSGNGMGGVAVAGFVSNMPLAAGVGFGLWKQPGTNVNQNNNGGNANQTQGQGQLQFQRQRQTQNQGQTQGQSQAAFGGAGGAGGAGGSVNTGGGSIGGTTITANGGASVNTGNVGIGNINQ